MRIHQVSYNFMKIVYCAPIIIFVAAEMILESITKIINFEDPLLAARPG